MKYVGGQAVIEGVLMKAEHAYAIAVRKPNGKIKVKREPHQSKTKTSRFLSLPFIRGMVILFEMLVVGMRAINWSANQQLDKEESISWFELAISITLSFGFAILIFVIGPYVLSTLVHPAETIRFQILDGVLRFCIFLIYILVISYLPDMRRLFEYHGAEHKTVHCYESGMPLSTRNIKKCPTAHLRCGTSLVVFVIVLSIILFSFVRTPEWWMNILARIVLVPIIGGIAYEVMRIATRYPSSKVLRVLSLPGLWFQSLTAIEPESAQINVAKRSLQAVTVQG